MRDFFFDTANTDAIKKYWNFISPDVRRSSVRGITTNPNAFFKLGKLSLQSWLGTIPYLCESIASMRWDNQGVLYIQGPSSDMGVDELYDFMGEVEKQSKELAYIGLKIPPYYDVLENLDHDSFLTNVTGIADCGTALKCLSYHPRYISIIPGRMEEVGIDAMSHIAYVKQANMKETEIIAGSMRTLDGLIRTFEYGTIPTIGERVWDVILEEGNFEKLQNNIICDYSISPFSPHIDERNTKLSEDFFIQMDKCGEQAYKDFRG